MSRFEEINSLSTNSAKWSHALKKFVGNLAANCLSLFDHFVGLALKGLTFSLLLVEYLEFIIIR